MSTGGIENYHHDCKEECKTMMVLGGYMWLTKPFHLLILSIAWTTCDLTIHSFTITMTVVTLVTTRVDKATAIQLGQTLCLLFATVAVKLINIYSSSGLKEATKLLEYGVYRYEYEDTTGNEIVRTRVDQVRMFVRFYTGMIMFVWSVTSFVIPLIKWLFSEGETTDNTINPYLPQPIYMPFDTNTPYGFVVAFLTNVLCFYTLFCSFICHICLTISYALQFTAQIEVLNNSLKNIRERACVKFYKNNPTYIGKMSEELYYNKEFQKCLYFCLKENIMHHQALWRYRNAISPFIGGTNTVGILFFSLITGTAIYLLTEDIGDNLIPVLFLFPDIGGYIQLSMVGQIISNKSNEIKDAVYSTPWYNCSKKFKTLLSIMLANTQEPIVFRDPWFGSKVSLETFGDMMSVGYKMMNLLR